MKKILKPIALSLLLVASTSYVSYAEETQDDNYAVKPIQQGIDVNQMMNDGISNHEEIKWISMTDLTNSLEDTKPMNVSFDFDSMFASTPVVEKTSKNKDKDEDEDEEKSSKKKKKKKSSSKKKKNSSSKKYAIAKQVIIDLIKMHKARGDSLYVVVNQIDTSNKIVDNDEDEDKEDKDSKKKSHSKDKKSKDKKSHGKSKKSKNKKSKNKSDSIMKILDKTFGTGVITKVIYAGNITDSKKSALLKQTSIALHYGDSDNDIISAHASAIRAIRLIRATKYNNNPLPTFGQYGEEVLKRSDR